MYKLSETASESHNFCYNLKYDQINLQQILLKTEQ